MRAVIFEEFGAPPAVAEVADPACPEDGVVVRVEATGLCRSDWHGWIGHDLDIALPHVPGHELAGEVVAVGAQVERWQVGDRVTTPFVLGCGRCPTCAAGDPQVCPDQHQPGFTHWGSYAELVALTRADANLVALPDNLDSAVAASLGCRFATAWRAVVQLGQATGGDTVAVHGCGGVGLSAVMIAASRGARVIAVDVSEDSLRLARELGAVETVDGTDAEVADRIADLTDGGADVSLDALGHTTTLTNSVLSLRRRGRHVQVGLLSGEHHRPSVPMDRVIGWELQLLGSHGMAAAAYPEMLADVLTGRLAPQRLLRHRIGLAQTPDALVGLGRPGSGAGGITVIDPQA